MVDGVTEDNAANAAEAVDANLDGGHCGMYRRMRVGLERIVGKLAGLAAVRSTIEIAAGRSGERRQALDFEEG